MKRLLLWITMSMLSCTLFGRDQNWLKWSKRDCERIIYEATAIGNTGFWSGVGEMVSTGSTKETMILATWMTPEVLKAKARLIQLEERLTEDETAILKQSFDKLGSGFWMIMISAESQWIFQGGGDYRKNELVDVSNKNRIFLQHRKNDQLFLRPVKIERLSPSVTEITNLKEIPSIDQDVILFFKQDPEFLIACEYEPEIQISQAGRKICAKFKHLDRKIGQVSEPSDADSIPLKTVEIKPDRLGATPPADPAVPAPDAGAAPETQEAADSLEVVSIITTPSGASVFINEKCAGVSPLQLRLPAGAYRVRLFLYGYKDWTQELTVSGQAVSLDATLSRSR